MGIMAIKLFEDGHCGLDSEQQLAQGLAAQIRSALGIPAPKPYVQRKESAPEEDWNKCPSIVIWFIPLSIHVIYRSMESNLN